MQPRLCDALLHALLRFRRIGGEHMHKSWRVSSRMLVEAQWVRSTLALISQDMHACRMEKTGWVEPLETVALLDLPVPIPAC